jgi:hypothetical protein
MRKKKESSSIKKKTPHQTRKSGQSELPRQTRKSC